MKLGIPIQLDGDESRSPHRISNVTEFLAPLGRTMFALVFLLPALGYFSGNGSFSQTGELPLTPAVEFLLGVLLLFCGLSVAVGYFARVGAFVLVLFLVPVTLWMHPFWLEVDPAQSSIAEAFFLRNFSIIGGALLLVYFGAGPMSADHRYSSYA